MILTSICWAVDFSGCRVFGRASSGPLAEPDSTFIWLVGINFGSAIPFVLSHGVPSGGAGRNDKTFNRRRVAKAFSGKGLKCQSYIVMLLVK